LHLEFFLIFYFFSHPSTFMLGHEIIRATEGHTKEIIAPFNCLTFVFFSCNNTREGDITVFLSFFIKIQNSLFKLAHESY
jgi:hypothetical protein